MNDSTTGPLVVGLLFILRCLIPLGILFGISYILQRLGLVDDRVEEKKTGPAKEGKGEPSVGIISHENHSPSRPISVQKQVRRKSATPKKRSRK
jgi:hypothetical protein